MALTFSPLTVDFPSAAAAAAAADNIFVVTKWAGRLPEDDRLQSWRTVELRRGVPPLNVLWAGFIFGLGVANGFTRPSCRRGGRTAAVGPSNGVDRDKELHRTVLAWYLSFLALGFFSLSLSPSSHPAPGNLLAPPSFALGSPLSAPSRARSLDKLGFILPPAEWNSPRWPLGASRPLVLIPSRLRCRRPLPPSPLRGR